MSISTGSTGINPHRGGASQGKVLVVIPNYNGLKHIEQCLSSVLAQTYQPLEVVVVDNASTDGSDRLIQERFPQIRFIQSGSNVGWGVACNTGMRASDSEYIVLMNNDAYLEKNCIEALVKAVNIDAQYGSAASRILLWDEPEKTEVCGLVIYPDGSSCGRGRLGPADQFLLNEEVFCANDCCNLYRRSMINEIGEYDPDFFIYCDETDMGWRHQMAGWKCIYTPFAVAYHAHSQSAGSYSAFKAYHVERNRIYICFKYFPMPMLMMSFVYAAWRYFSMWRIAFWEDRGALAHYQKHSSLSSGLSILLKAHRDAFRKLPVMWKRRREIFKKRKISNEEIRGLFKRFGITTRQMAGYE